MHSNKKPADGSRVSWCGCSWTHPNSDCTSLHLQLEPVGFINTGIIQQSTWITHLIMCINTCGAGDTRCDHVTCPPNCTFNLLWSGTCPSCPCTVAFLPLTLLKEGKLASTVTQAATQVSQLLVHHSQSLHYYIIWQEMGPNESRQEDGNERVTAQKASPALSGRQLQAGTSDLTSFNMSEMV